MDLPEGISAAAGDLVHGQIVERTFLNGSVTLGVLEANYAYAPVVEGQPPIGHNKPPRRISTAA